MNPPPSPARYSLLEFCQLTRLGRSTAYERIAAGLLSVTKDGRRTFVAREEVERYLAACPSVARP